MDNIDEFATLLLEESKRFLELAKDAPDAVSKTANLHAAMMLGCCSLEAHVNAIADELSARADVSIHDKGVLLEKDVRLENGEFLIKPNLKIIRLEDRIEFLHRRFAGKPVDRQQAWWAALGGALNLRNQLTHPKAVPQINEGAVASAIEAIIDAIGALYQGIYKRRFPAANRGLQSKLTF